MLQPQLPFDRQSLRLPDYDYSQEGSYFVTLVTQDRQCLLGEVAPKGKDAETVFNLVGRMVKKWWLEIINKFPGVSLETFVVMPNHLHGIINIDDLNVIVGAGSSRPVTLGQVLAYFKYESTKEFNTLLLGRENRAPTNNRANFTKLWQRNYYEHIIRNETDLSKIQEYITTNPYYWSQDDENPNKIRKLVVT